MVDISEGFTNRTNSAWDANPFTTFQCPYDGSPLNMFDEENPDWSEATYEIHCAACGTLFFVSDGEVSYETDEANFDDAGPGDEF